jgi:hypothetical protein
VREVWWRLTQRERRLESCDQDHSLIQDSSLTIGSARERSIISQPTMMTLTFYFAVKGWYRGAVK